MFVNKFVKASDSCLPSLKEGAIDRSYLSLMEIWFYNAGRIDLTQNDLRSFLIHVVCWFTDKSCRENVPLCGALLSLSVLLCEKRIF